jgi:integrase
MHVAEVERGEDDFSVSVVISRYFHSLKREKRDATLHLARTMLDPAIADFGHVKVKELRPIVVTDWLAKMADRPAKGREKPWNESTRNTAASVLARAFNWAKALGIVTRNPVAGMAKPEKLVRGREVMLPDALEALLIEKANRELAKFLRMLQGTGARPGEVIHAECRHYRPALSALVFSWNDAAWRWKNAKKTKRDRVIYLTDDLRRLVEAEVKARGGTGRIFRTVRGREWNNNSLTNIIIKLASHRDVRAWCEANGFDGDKIMAYSFRHGYITRMLTRGCPIKVLADWCGTWVAMIEKTYSHAHDDHQAMLRLHRQFNGGAASAPPAP